MLNLQQRINAALRPIRRRLIDLPVRGSGVSGGSSSGSVAALGSQYFSPTYIDNQDFKPGIFLANAWSVIGSFRIPENTRVNISQGKSYRLHLDGLAKRDGNNDAGGARNFTVADIIQSKRGQPTFPNTYHPDIRVYAKVGAVWSPAQVNSVNFSTGVINVTEPANCTDIEIYYATSSGQWRLRSRRKLGNSDDQSTLLANGSVSALHTTDQNNIETAFLFPRSVGLVPGYELTLEVLSPNEIVIGARSQTEVLIKAETQDLLVLSDESLRRSVEVDTRQGV